MKEPVIANPDQIQGEMRDYVIEYIIMMKYRFDVFMDFIETNDHPENIAEDREYYRTWFIASHTLTTPPRTYPIEIQDFLNKMYHWAFDGNMYVLLRGNEINTQAAELFLDRYETYKREFNINDEEEQRILEDLLKRYNNTEEHLSDIALQYYEFIKNKDYTLAYQLLSSESVASITVEEFVELNEEKYHHREIKGITYLGIEDDTSRTTYVQLQIEETLDGKQQSYRVYIPLTWENEDEWLVQYRDIFMK